MIWAGVVRVSGRCGDQPWSQPVVTVFRGNQRLLASAKLWKSYTQPSPVCGSSYYNQHIKADHKIGQLLFFLKPKIEKIIIGYRRDSDRLPLPWSPLVTALLAAVICCVIPSSPGPPGHPDHWLPRILRQQSAPSAGDNWCTASRHEDWFIINELWGTRHK